jgi:hypothetical protein
VTKTRGSLAVDYSKSFYSFVTSESQVLSPGDALIVDCGMRIAEFSNLRLILRRAQDAAW